MRAERDELAVAERVLERVSEQLADERASAAPAPGQMGGRAVMLVPHRTPDMEETMLPPDYQRILATARQAAGPGMARQVSDALGIDASERSKLEPLRGKLVDLLRRHLKVVRSRWRTLPPGKIAVIVLAVLRHDQRLADMAGGNNVSESTVRRCRDELIALLAAQAPRLDRALKKVARQGGEVVLIYGTLFATQRRTRNADRRNYSGKHHRHGLHFLALTDGRGRLIWISAARPGRTHDNTAARHDHLQAHLRAAGLGALADLGFRGLDNGVLDPLIVTGFHATRTHKLAPARRPPTASSPTDAHRSSTASPTSRIGGSSPNSAPNRPAPPASCAPCSS